MATTKLGRRVAFDVARCDCCGVVDRECEPVAFGRSGLAMFTAVLCRRCCSRVEDAVVQAIKQGEARATA